VANGLFVSFCIEQAAFEVVVPFQVTVGLLSHKTAFNSERSSAFLKIEARAVSTVRCAICAQGRRTQAWWRRGLSIVATFPKF
jgi:hypothetical protein